MNHQANQQLNSNNPSSQLNSHLPNNRLGNCHQTSLPTRQFPQISPSPAIQTGSPHPNHRAYPKIDPTNPVTTAANACHQGVTDANNIAVTPAEVPPTVNASVTLANSKCNATDHCHTDASGKFAMPFNAATQIESLSSISVSALDPAFNSGQTATKIDVLASSSADKPVTDVTLATGRRHTATDETPVEAVHQAASVAPNSTSLDAKTAVSTPTQVGLTVTDVTLATGRRHTVTDETPVEAVHQAASVLPNNTPPDAKTAVPTPVQAGLTVTDVTLATGRRHTTTDEPASDAIIQYILADSPTPPIASADATESDNDDDDPLRSCKYCGEPFQPRSIRHKYCSNVCRVYAHYLRHGGRKCKVCGKPTPLPSRSVCSEACRAQLPYYRPGCYDEPPTAPSEE